MRHDHIPATCTAEPATETTLPLVVGDAPRMDQLALKTGLSVAWIALVVVQTAAGLVRAETFFAALGAVDALLGAGYYWAEVSRHDGNE